MKNRNLLPLLTTLLVIFLFACDKEENGTQQRLELQSVGFAGTLPDGRSFRKTGIVASNWVGSSSSTDDGSYIRHGLTVSDTLAKINILLELPQIKYSNDFIKGSEDANDLNETKKVAREYYPYLTVKEKLRVGAKILGFGPAPDLTKSFWLQVTDNVNYNDFVSYGLDQAGSYLKVTDLVEGTEPDPVLGQVKTLEVTFDLDVKMYPAREPKPTSPAKLKGLLRMKFREL